MKFRGFAKLINGKFSPTPMGMALIYLYNNLQIPIYSPELRATMEDLIKRVAEGNVIKDDALVSIKERMKGIFRNTCNREDEMINYIRNFLNDMQVEINNLLIRDDNRANN